MKSRTPQNTGKAYWRSLAELADTPQFRAEAQQEFPQGFFDQLDGTSRRRFLQVMGASLALAGLSSLPGCRRWTKRRLAPLAHRPEGYVPGQPQSYATAFELSGVARPVLITSVDGRPIKIEGNPLHPASQGAADAISQASILELYDPERSQRFRQRTGANKRPARTRQQFFTWADDFFSDLRNRRGEGLAILCEATSSTTIAMIRDQMSDRMPQARWYSYEPVNRSNELGGARLAFGQAVRTHLHLDAAEVIACFDADLFLRHPAAAAYASDWAKGRRSADSSGTMNRMYVAEAPYSITGASADQRLAIRSSRIGNLLLALAGHFGSQTNPAPLTPVEQAFVDALAQDLRTHRGRSVLTAGPQQPPEVHALIHQLNASLGNIGTTVTYSEEPNADRPEDVEALQQLSDELRAGKTECLLILGGNPAYDAPTGLKGGDFASALGKARTSIHLSLYDNETSHLCTWHAPRAHWLEAWGDTRAYDGTISVSQPLIQPLFDGLSSVELLARAVDVRSAADGGKHPLQSGYELVREAFRNILPAASFEHDWQHMLYQGMLPNSSFKPVRPHLQRIGDVGERVKDGKEHSALSLEVVFLPGSAVYDGRFANNGWLQELPDPITKLTWDNAALLAPDTAGKLGVKTEQMIRLQTADGAGSIELPVLVTPGIAADVVVLHQGYGRSAAGHVGNYVGFNVYPLRAVGACRRGFAAVTALEPLSRTYPLAVTEQYHAIETRLLEEKFNERVKELVREGTLEEYRQHPRFATESDELSSATHKPLQLWQEPVSFDQAAPNQWGMTIDLNLCIGCNACIVACQAENNIPIVGKQEVARGREMHWLRVDRYYRHPAPETTDLGQAQMVFQPVSCQQCENAPCEQVCPAGATVHDSEGLNVMVYNRCVGTRYCSNNCPYKVRRFNYFDWHSRDPRTQGLTPPFLGIPDQQQGQQVNAIKQMVYNPDVSIRMRGVMEKCTYCVQRLKAGEHTARTQHAQGQRADLQLHDGEVQTACAQTCPTRAITFGNLKDPKSQVRRLQKENPRSYAMLGELNVRPRTTYLAKLRNPQESPNKLSGKQEG